MKEIDLINARKTLKEKMDKLIAENYNHQTFSWYIDKNTKKMQADEKQTKAFQNELRNLKNKFRFVGERYLAENGELVDKLRFVPLVNRRGIVDPDIKAKIYTRGNDGDLFTFGPGYTYKHTIGNWDCSSCLNIGAEIKTADDADRALSNSVKGLAWCPKFIALLRQMDVESYLNIFKEVNVCYAGLLHSQLNFVEKYFDDKGMEITDLVAAGFSDHPERLPKKHYAQIIKMCDTCAYTVTEEKEYTPPEQIEEGQVLQTFE